VVEATEHRECPDIAYPSRLHRGGCSVARDVLADPLMRPVLVEIGHVLPEHAPQVGLAQDEQVIEALTSNAVWFSYLVTPPVYFTS